MVVAYRALDEGEKGMSEMIVPENFPERFGRIEQRIEDLWEMHNGKGCASQQRLGAKVDGLFLAGTIVTTGFCAWMAWLTLQTI